MLGILPRLMAFSILVDPRHWRHVSSASHGFTAEAPKPTRHAKWCVEKAEADSTTMDARDRRPTLMRWWCTAPTASMDGMAGIVASPQSGLSEMITVWDPPATAFSAAAQSSATAAAIAPFSPVPAYLAGTRTALRESRPMMVSTSSSKSTGVLRCTAGMSSAPLLSRRFPLAPRVISSDMTRPSRSGSIAGLVTCANLCLK